VAAAHEHVIGRAGVRLAQPDWREIAWSPSIRVVAAIAAALFVAGLAASLTHGPWRFWTLPWPDQVSLWLGVAANASVFAVSAFAQGRARNRVAAVMLTALMVHGVALGAIVFLPLNYDRLSQLVFLLCSVVFGLGFVYVSARMRRQRIAIAPNAADPETIDRLIADGVEVARPDMSFRGVEILVVDMAAPPTKEWAAAHARAALCQTEIRHIATHLEIRQGRVSLDDFHLEQASGRVGNRVYDAVKRMLDIMLVLIAAPIAVTIVLIAAVAILVTMGRPIFFVQPRVGRGGRLFNMIKLRTMSNAPMPTGPLKEAEGQHRITALGLPLRRHRIDELPQLWNVLTGDMSLIGPRPEWFKLADSFQRDLPVYAYRHLVRPGITGWAQVNFGYAADLAQTRTKISYDLYYVKHLSFWLDLQIMLRTVLTLIKAEGAR
jgi:lipopolysaccharide/colanic/teichoic acid biosynthesis glycosyltransferase